MRITDKMRLDHLNKSRVYQRESGEFVIVYSMNDYLLGSRRPSIRSSIDRLIRAIEKAAKRAGGDTRCKEL